MNSYFHCTQSSPYLGSPDNPMQELAATVGFISNPQPFVPNPSLYNYLSLIPATLLAVTQLIVAIKMKNK
ncbi:hypothetical protein H6H03_17535 [Nostoc paludosum FACHB-159]|uniref:Uncharacterized protein n=1 Tax=Nostoc paludosum FACHB-159 TaxID=2692908 RepID=A0ABR8KBK6_9NOSO|nr:hypothetical protein [Nostoc paludosum FACHB-159]